MDSIIGKILSAAGRSPDKTAYICDNESITYGELAKRAAALASFLDSTGSPVLIYGHRSPYMITGMLACLICGRAYIPCDISIPQERIRMMMKLSGAATVIAAEGSVTAEDINIITADDIKALPVRDHTVFSDSNAAAYIIFTSGSTGVPKGIEIRRRSLDNFADYAEKVYFPDGGGENMVMGGHALFSFDLSIADIFVTLAAGGTLYSFDKIPSRNINILTCTPAFLRMCLLSKDFSPENYSALHTVLCCGETLPVRTAAALKDRFGDIRLINAYGPAECCCFVCAHEIGSEDILRCENGLPIGDINFTASEISFKNGEIFIKGESASGRYIVGDQGGFSEGGYYTGDRGIIREELIYFDGRIKDGMIKYSGYRIELGEIESALCGINGIKDCCVRAVTDKNGTVTLLKAEIVCSGEINSAAIKNELARRLPAYMIPKVIEKSDIIPVSRNGKTQKTVWEE